MQIRYGVALLVVISLVTACQCDIYYSYSNSKNIKDSLFNVECQLVPDVAEKAQRLEVSIDFKDRNAEAVKRGSIEIYPVLNNKDTLQLSSSYASQYLFELSKNVDIQQLDLIVKYKVDSSGVVSNKRRIYNKLERNKTCRYRPVLH